MASQYVWWLWLRGLPVEIMRNYVEFFRDLIKQGQLEEIGQQVATPNQVMSLGFRSAFSGSGLFGVVGRLLGFNVGPVKIPDIDIRGGIRAPHIHLDGKIYYLSERQWSDFSQNVIQDFQVRLDAAKSVPLTVDQLVSIGVARNELGG
jgi:hypothetical protein